MKKIIFISLSFFLGISQLAFSQVITKVKDQKALLDLQGQPVQEGEEFFGLDSQGKRKSILRIKQIKGDRAVADILKGKADVGQTLQARTGGSGSSSDSENSSHSKKSMRPTWGIMGGFAQDKMDASFTYSSTSYIANMKGNGFTLTGYYDHPLSPNFILRASGGLEQFIGSASMSASVCGSGTSSSCDVNVLYLSAYGQAKYNLNLSPTKYWVAGGLGYLFPMTKSSNVLDTSKLTTWAIVPSVGVDIAMPTGILPIQLDYVLFPDSQTVKANAIVIRAGWGWYF